MVVTAWSATEFKSDSLGRVVYTPDIDWPSSSRIWDPVKVTLSVVEDPVALGLLGGKAQLCCEFINCHRDAGIIWIGLVVLAELDCEGSWKDW